MLLTRISINLLILEEVLMSQMFLSLTKRISRAGKLGKFNAFKALEGEKVNGTFIRPKCLLNDLENNGVIISQVEVNAIALLVNQKRFYKRSGKVGSARKPMDKSNEICFACGKQGHFQKECPSKKSSTRSYPSSNKASTPSKSKKGLVAESFDWNEESVSSEDEGTTKIKAFMAIAEEESSVRKADARFEPRPPLPKLIGAELAGTSNSLISLAGLTLNMADLTLNKFVLNKSKPTSDKVLPTYVIKKKTKTKSPVVLVPQPKKKDDLSTEQLLLTLMDEVNSLKEQIKVPLD
nr:hypothetical protein [Tanacetum cinerariifolium]